MIKIMPVGIPSAAAGGLVFPGNTWSPVLWSTAKDLIRRYPGKIHAVDFDSGQVIALPTNVNNEDSVQKAGPAVVADADVVNVDVIPATGVVEVTNAAVEPQVVDELSVADKVRKAAPQLTDDDIMALEAAPVDTWTVDYICKAANVKGKVAKLILKAVSG